MSAVSCLACTFLPLACTFDVVDVVDVSLSLSACESNCESSPPRRMGSSGGAAAVVHLPATHQQAGAGGSSSVGMETRNLVSRLAILEGRVAALAAAKEKLQTVFREIGPTLTEKLQSALADVACATYCKKCDTCLHKPTSSC